MMSVPIIRCRRISSHAVRYHIKDISPVPKGTDIIEKTASRRFSLSMLPEIDFFGFRYTAFSGYIAPSSQKATVYYENNHIGCVDIHSIKPTARFNWFLFSRIKMSCICLPNSSLLLSAVVPNSR